MKYEAMTAEVHTACQKLHSALCRAKMGLELRDGLYTHVEPANAVPEGLDAADRMLAEVSEKIDELRLELLEARLTMS